MERVGVDNDPNSAPPTIGLSQFLKDIEIQKDDFVVMKMDVEGMEYGLIERMLEDGSHVLVDEVHTIENGHWMERVRILYL